MIDDPMIPPAGVLQGQDAQAEFRVWAPKAKGVELILDPDAAARRLAMTAEPRGFFAVTTAAKPGDRYAYSLDGGTPLPDPLSRWQPDGIDRPSAVFWSEAFTADDAPWKGVARADLVVYELLVNAFTTEGTFDAVIPRLASLRDLGITAIELMPVAQFPGTRGWGYDGVFPFAVQNTYGGPEGLKRLIDACHQAGLGVILDVVYNHFGPQGNVFPQFGPYFNERYRTDWGPAVNYDGNSCGPVRQMVLDNARMWVRDYRVDGLRLDAADQIYDRGPTPILRELAEVVHREAGLRGFPCHVFAETDMNNAPLFLGSADAGGYALDGHWTDDFHHAAHVVLTGDASGYFRDFADGPKALAKVIADVFVNDGGYSDFRDRRHGAPATEFAADRFLAFVQNHDQIANGNFGKRHAEILEPAASRLAAGLLLLSPRIPLLFMGEEYGETNPFPYYCDFSDPGLIEAVRKGRAAEFAYFQRTEEPPDPVGPETRYAAVLSWDWTSPFRSGLRQLYDTLLTLRKESPTLRDFRHARTRLIGEDLLEVVRGESASSLRILFNLSGQVRPFPAETLAEPPAFRSESADPRNSQVLQPYEFAIFGELPPDRPSA